MNPSAPLPPSGIDPADAAVASGESVLPGAFERLRDLLVGEERRALDAAHARIVVLENAQANLAHRLPDAALEALRRETGNPRVPIALADPLTEALGIAVQTNRQSLVDTLFPVIGPLIRKAIAEALRTLVVDVNGAIESSFSPRGLRWRVEAWRAGVPYSQIALKYRLNYRIDHLFLIERESGLVLHTRSAPELPALDPDAIAGMLTALGDFVGDSVGQGRRETLESMRVGDYVVWVIDGPRANLAGFFRGIPPPALRALLEQRLEDLHAHRATESSRVWSRSPENDAQWSATLEPATLLRELGAGQPASTRRTSRTPLYVAAALIVFALGWAVVSRERWNLRIDALHSRLANHPGFVLSGIDSRRWTSVTVRGLLDPDASPLQPVVAAAELGNVDVVFDVDGYLSTSDTIVARRAVRLLAPPPGVTVAVKDGVLSLAGHAQTQWIATARERAGWVAGVAGVAFAVAGDVDPIAAARSELDSVVREVSALRVTFLDETDTSPQDTATLEHVVRAARQALALAKTAHVRVVFTSIGLNDGSGRDETNERLRAARARWLANALGARGVEVEVGNASAAEAASSNARAAYLRASIEKTTP